MKESEYSSIRGLVIKAIEEMEIGEKFTGAEFKQMIVNKYPYLEKKYVASLLRPIFDYNKTKDKKVGVVCLNKVESLYQIVAPLEYDDTHSLEKRVLVTEKRFQELCEKEKWYDKHSAEINKWRNAKQQEFAFEC